MPFVALNPSGERVCSLDHEDLRQEYKRGDLICPLCRVEMIYKKGSIVRSHFAHKTECQSEYETKPESPEHLAGKDVLRKHLMGRYGNDAVVDLEYPLKEINRIADVIVLFNGWIEIHEIQFSPITVELLEARTADYESIGASVHWWLGPKCMGPQKDWAMARFGEVHRIEPVMDVA